MNLITYYSKSSFAVIVIIPSKYIFIGKDDITWKEETVCEFWWFKNQLTHTECIYEQKNKLFVVFSWCQSNAEA